MPNQNVPSAETIDEMIKANAEKFDFSVVNNVIEQMSNFASQTIDFASTQMPLLIHEILTYSLVEHATKAIILLGIGGFFFHHCIKVWKSIDDFEDNENEGKIFWSIFGRVFASGIMIWGTVHFFDVLKIYFAPRLFIIEYLKAFM